MLEMMKLMICAILEAAAPMQVSMLGRKTGEVGKGQGESRFGTSTFPCGQQKVASLWPMRVSVTDL